MFKTYLKAILIPLILGGLVGFLTRGSMDFNSLNKPFLAPPGFIFPIVWSILYILMGIGYARLKSQNLITDKIFISYYLQLFVNLVWPFLFFTLKWRLFAFIWILLLALLVLNMIIQFYQKDKWAGLIQIPYLLWVLFATYLNLFFYILN